MIPGKNNKKSEKNSEKVMTNSEKCDIIKYMQFRKQYADIKAAGNELPLGRS